jgi:glucokinase
MARESCAIGIEIGGTVLRMGLVGEDGSVAASTRRDSAHLRDQSSAARLLRGDLDKFLQDTNVSLQDCAGIGIGAAGLVDNEAGTMVLASNLGWRDFHLGDELSSLMSAWVVMDKDTNMAALGELAAGAGRDLNSFIYATLGTGVGGSVVYDRKLLRGIGNRAGEFGHVIAGGDARCGCGSLGCLETVAGAVSIARRAREAVESGTRSRIAELAGGSPEGITSRTIVQAAEQDDDLAGRILAEAARAVGVALINAVRMIYPEAVILGGSLAGVDRFIFQPIKEFVESNSALPGTSLPPVRVLPAQLGDFAAVIGSALSVFGRS